VDRFADFDLVRRMHDQPLISQVPLGLGPFFVVSDFVKDWSAAVIRPLEGEVTVDREYVLGYPAGRYPLAGRSLGPERRAPASYQFDAPWWLGMPYPPGVR
jgi:hypothetical protein